MTYIAPVLEKTESPGLVAVDGRTYPLKSTRLSARAEAGLAQSTLVQRFANPYPEALEVMYSLAVPADGAVTGYRIRIGDTVLTGKIETREQAAKEYQKALAQGRLGGLMEQERADIFTQWLGNVPAGAEVEVEVDLLHPLLFQAGRRMDPEGEDVVGAGDFGGAADSGPAHGRWEYRFPTVPGVRYLGEKERTPDATRLDVKRSEGPAPVRLDLDLRLAGGKAELLSPISSSHEILVENAGDAACLVRLADPTRLDRDISVKWRATENEIGIHLATGPGLPKDNGCYGLLAITPPDLPMSVIPRDLILLLDCSGSMHGSSMETVRRMAHEVIQSLGQHDSFEIIAFADRPERYATRPLPGDSEETARALQWIDRLEAGGATEMAEAMMEALRPLRPGAQRQVLLMTDGYIGFENEVIQRIGLGLPESCRVHVVGIGSAPNRSLSRPAARFGQGLEILASGPESAGEAAARLLAGTVAPLLTEIEVTGSAVRGIAPRRIPDLYKGCPGRVCLELDPKGGEILVSGRLGEGQRWTRTISAPAVDVSQGLPLGALFGRETIEDLECDRLIGEQPPSMVDEQIEERALRHRIPSRRTSLVAVSENPVIEPGQTRRLVRPAQELPHGVSAEGVGMATGGRRGGAMGDSLMQLCTSEMRLACFEATEDVEAEFSSLTDDAELELPSEPQAPSDWDSLADCLVFQKDRPARDSMTSVTSWETRISLLFSLGRARIEGDRLILEFLALEDILRGPRKRSIVFVELQGTIFRAQLQVGSTSARRTLRNGQPVRLVLRRCDGRPWPAFDGRVRWADSDGWIVFSSKGVESMNAEGGLEAGQRDGRRSSQDDPSNPIDDTDGRRSSQDDPSNPIDDTDGRPEE